MAPMTKILGAISEFLGAKKDMIYRCLKHDVRKIYVFIIHKNLMQYVYQLSDYEIIRKILK